MATDTDTLLLYHSMMLMVTADGSASTDELALLQAFCKTVPELREADLVMLQSRWQEFASGYGDRYEALGSLVAMKDERMCKKAFVLACDLALSHEGISGDEYEALNDIAAALGIGDSEALGIINVLALKYA